MLASERSPAGRGLSSAPGSPVRAWVRTCHVRLAVLVTRTVVGLRCVSLALPWLPHTSCCFHRSLLSPVPISGGRVSKSVRLMARK